MPILGHARAAFPARIVPAALLDFPDAGRPPACRNVSQPVVGSVMRRYFLSLLVGLIFCCPVLRAQTPAAASTSDRLAKLEAQVAQAQSSADNAWMLTSSALVLMMTGPGLALVYRGLVRKKNVLATMMQSFAMMAIISVLWAVVNYSLAFGSGTSFIGGLHNMFLRGVGLTP